MGTSFESRSSAPSLYVRIEWFLTVTQLTLALLAQDHALIQFSSPSASQSALVHLRGFTLLGRSLEISFSKHSYISTRPAAGGDQCVETSDLASKL